MGRKLKRGIAALLAGILISNSGITTVHATAEVENQTPEQSAYEQVLQNAYDKKIETNELKGWPQGPKVYGEAAIAMDMETGAVLYGKGIDEKHYPASITKVLTALVAVENSSLTDTVTITQDSVDCICSGYAHIGMRPGEVITMKDALHALLLASANEVAYAIGETVGGTHENFVKMMNDKAKELGCENTHFINTNGIFDEQHYTSARDMALIARAAFSHQELRDVVQTKQYVIPPTNLVAEQRVFQQKHKMMKNGQYHDDRCVGGKTGYTDEAHNTLVTIMNDGEREVACVILKSRKDTYPDTKSICDYALQNFKQVNIAQNEKSKKLESIDQDAYVTLPANVDFSDLKWKIDANNNLKYTYGGQIVGTTKVSAEDIKTQIIEEEPKQEKKEVISKDLAVKIIIVFAAIALVAGLILIVMSIKRKRRRRGRGRSRNKKFNRIDRKKRRRRRKGRWG